MLKASLNEIFTIKRYDKSDKTPKPFLIDIIIALSR